ncbi:MAG: hypothetical protein QOI26_1088, partial [Pseudonocardiales bacterium]|nr:hypothetical protein [Pseudonocardiales bacterium]
MRQRPGPEPRPAMPAAAADALLSIRNLRKS